MMKRFILGMFLFFVLCTPFTVFAEVEIPEKPTSHIYVQDYANVLSEEAKTKVQTMGEDIYANTKAQVVVVTINSLQGESIKEYALTILRKWGVGDKDLDNGIVMLVAVNDHKARIEVGYGLEGALPDGKCGQILREKMTPEFKNNHYDAGVLNGYEAIKANIDAEYNVEAATAQQGDEEEGFFDWVAIIIGSIVIIGIPIWFIYFLYQLFWGQSSSNESSTYDHDSSSSSNCNSDEDDYGGGDGGGGGADDSW